MNVLLVIPNEELATVFERNVNKAVGSLAYSFICSKNNEKDAYAAISRGTKKGPYDLLIVALDIPTDSAAPLDLAQQNGVSLLRRVRNDSLNTPAILVIDNIDNQLFGLVAKLEPCVPFLKSGDTWEDNLIRQVQNLLPSFTRTGQKAGPSKVSRVDIFLNFDRETGNYSMLGELNIEMEPLKVNFFRLKKLVRRSWWVGQLHPPDWQDAFCDVGGTLLDELFANNWLFAQNFRTLVERSRGAQNVKIRFVIEPKAHPIALEALIDERNEYWMLRSPIYRKAYIVGDENALSSFDNTAWIGCRCLIIQAATEGSATGVPTQLGQLQYANDEGRWLMAFLKRNGIYVERLNGSRRSPASWENVKKRLKNDSWDIVHYIGHSFYDPRRGGKGTVFFPGLTGPEAVSCDDFAVNLREARTRLVYMSSCRSAAFAFELATKRIPSIVAFRWDIDDDKAVEHTKRFYGKLIKDRKPMEFAFLDLRKELHEEYGENLIWAASMLITQVEND
jgi:CHAT domain